MRKNYSGIINNVQNSVVSCMAYSISALSAGEDLSLAQKQFLLTGLGLVQRTQGEMF